MYVCCKGWMLGLVVFGYEIINVEEFGGFNLLIWWLNEENMIDNFFMFNLWFCLLYFEFFLFYICLVWLKYIFYLVCYENKWIGVLWLDIIGKVVVKIIKYCLMFVLLKEYFYLIFIFVFV